MFNAKHVKFNEEWVCGIQCGRYRTSFKIRCLSLTSEDNERLKADIFILL